MRATSFSAAATAGGGNDEPFAAASASRTNGGRMQIAPAQSHWSTAVAHVKPQRNARRIHLPERRDAEIDIRHLDLGGGVGTCGSGTASAIV